MAITQHSAATEQSFDSEDFTFSYDLTSGGSDIMLVVWIATEKNANVTDVDWDNGGTPTALTQVITATAVERRCSIWTLKNPSARGNLVIRVQAGVIGKCGVVVKGYAGVDIADTGSTDTDGGTNDPALTLPSTVSGSLGIDIFTSETSGTSIGSETEIHEGDTGGGSYGAQEVAITGSSQIMSWDIEDGKKQAYCGIELTAVAGVSRTHFSNYVNTSAII